MIASLLNIFRVPDLRRKILLTLLLIAVYRVGAFVHTPFIDASQMNTHFQNSAGGGVFGVIDMFSGGAFLKMSIFALGIMPYISASIILQLLTYVWPTLQKISKEGEAGQKKITQWTRYGTVALSLFQGTGIGVYLLEQQGLVLIPNHQLIFLFITAMTLTTGTCFIMWLGEKITEHGIGNGISIIIAAGIMARYPADVHIGLQSVNNDTLSPIGFVMILALMILITALIVINQVASRKVPVEHARRMVGKRMMQGASTFIPLKLNTAGVIPVIFAASILSFPGLILPLLGGDRGFGGAINSWLSMTSPHNFYSFLNLSSGGVFNILKAVNLYTFLYVILTVFFCFYYTAITLNPLDLSDNLKKSGAFIPGVKPGKATADYIDQILVRITVVGAALLIVVAMVPEILYVAFGINYQFASLAGGTGLIIVVGVVLDTMKQIESQLMMRRYEGFGTAGAASGAKQRLRPRRVA